MTWSQPKFDKHAFADRRAKAVKATRTKEGWDTTGISFADFGSMHVHHREKVQERRLPTPKWAVHDELLRELLCTYLEERFYVRNTDALTHVERLKSARAAAEAYCPYKRILLKNWLADYHTISIHGRRDLTDEQAIDVFTQLKEVGGQLPLDADVARDYLSRKKLHDLEIQIQNIDTDIVLTERGHAEVIAAIVYLYYRLGWDSVTCAEQLKLKSPHVRQVLARLHSTWDSTLSQRYGNAGVEKDQRGTPPDSLVQGVESSAPPNEPLAAIFEEQQ